MWVPCNNPHVIMHGSGVFVALEVLPIGTQAIKNRTINERDDWDKIHLKFPIQNVGHFVQAPIWWKMVAYSRGP